MRHIETSKSPAIEQGFFVSGPVKLNASRDLTGRDYFVLSGTFSVRVTTARNLVSLHSISPAIIRRVEEFMVRLFCVLSYAIDLSGFGFNLESISLLLPRFHWFFLVG
ncbi:hypothetical protein KIH32_19340 [Pseudomonas fluorescens]|uniref:hypothetical protein n=1 Tax=Pseudomonas fluorescens TaxID=294 RepID=UPI001BDAD393|nr:hypothetical protein [Pseudomonas fluorescens]MBT0626073.1 hypothetical protein [Pseudomonas fluorescens]